MNRPVLFHALALGAALITAYFVWTRDLTPSEDKIPILSLRSGLDRVVYTAPDRMVELTRKKDERGSFYWARVETVEEQRIEPPKPPASAPAAAPATASKSPESKSPESKSPTSAPATPPAQPPAQVIKKQVRKAQQFKCNKATAEVMEGLSTFSAIRSLGLVDKDKLKAFGLAESKKTITLVTGSSPHAFLIGGNTYGNLDLYLQDRQDGRVYVVAPRLIQDLQYAEFRLVDRELHAFVISDIDRVVLSATQRKKALVQQNRRDPATAYWADEATPDKRKDLYRNFMGKLQRLQALEYVVAGDKLAAESSEVLAVEYFAKGRPQGIMRLFQGAMAAPAKPGENATGEREYYVLTDNTRGKVKVNPRVGFEIARDIAAVMKD